MPLVRLARPTPTTPLKPALSKVSLRVPMPYKELIPMASPKDTPWAPKRVPLVTTSLVDILLNVRGSLRPRVIWLVRRLPSLSTVMV
ncbi:hypothetical protein D3C77_417490 [compost metagenome]